VVQAVAVEAVANQDRAILEVMDVVLLWVTVLLQPVVVAELVGQELPTVADRAVALA